MKAVTYSHSFQIEKPELEIESASQDVIEPPSHAETNECPAQKPATTLLVQSEEHISTLASTSGQVNGENS